MTGKLRIIGGLALLCGLGLLTGCGTQVAGGGQPSPQPITSQTGNNLNTSTTGTSSSSGSTSPSSTGKDTTSGTKGASSSSGTPSASTAGSKSGSTSASGSTATGKGTSAAGGSKAGSGSGAGTSGPSSTSHTVTVHVEGASPLVATPVSSGNGNGGFVAVPPSAATVLVPAGWTLTDSASGGSGSTVRLTNPKDAAQSIVEDIQPSSRDLEGFYQGQSAGQVQWLIPQQVVQFALQNPSNPNPDLGILANLSTGGSIRVDVYLPASDKSMALQILHSFAGTK